MVVGAVIRREEHGVVARRVQRAERGVGDARFVQHDAAFEPEVGQGMNPSMGVGGWRRLRREQHARTRDGHGGRQPGTVGQRHRRIIRPRRLRGVGGRRVLAERRLVVEHELPRARARVDVGPA